jgi:hypothetical protein
MHVIEHERQICEDYTDSKRSDPVPVQFIPDPDPTWPKSSGSRSTTLVQWLLQELLKDAILIENTVR